MYTMEAIRVQPCAKVIYPFDIHNTLRIKNEKYCKIVLLFSAVEIEDWWKNKN